MLFVGEIQNIIRVKIDTKTSVYVFIGIIRYIEILEIYLRILAGRAWSKTSSYDGDGDGDDVTDGDKSDDCSLTLLFSVCRRRSNYKIINNKITSPVTWQKTG